jgi:monoterpene epsilon-lactone hydrolase
VLSLPSPEHEQIVALIRSSSNDEVLDRSFEEGRAWLEQIGEMFAVPDGIEIEPFRVDDIACERLLPTDLVSGESPPRILYLHGGAYTIGSLGSHRAFAARLAMACRREVVAVDYRLAPEHPYPAGLDDARTVYHHLLDLGTAAEDLVIMGDSAGGGLTAALLVNLRDLGEALPAGAVLFSPWLDLTLTSDTVRTKADEDPFLTSTSLARSARAYAGQDLRRPEVSPVFADLVGLPPMLIFVGTAEILLDDSRTFAARARTAGVAVDLDVEDGLIHVWPFIDGIPEAAAALDRVVAWVAHRSAFDVEV